MALAAKLYLDARSSERFDVGVDATLRGVDMLPIDVLVVNLSSTGCAIETPARLEKGAAVRLGLGQAGICEAKIVRRQGKIYGCEFVSPMSQADVAKALSADTVVMTDFGTRRLAGGSVGVDLPEPYVDKLPLTVRIAIMVLASVTIWVMIVLTLGWLVR